MIRCRRMLAVVVWGLALAVAGCDRLDMYDQPRYEPQEPSDFFADGQSSRPEVAGTIARGSLHDDIPFHTGKDSGQEVSEIPEAAYRAIFDRNPHSFGNKFDKAEPALRKALLTRGRERYDIYCSVCHGLTGDGDGMIVRRGFSKPPSYHDERLKQSPNGHYFAVITDGFGAMVSYANRIETADRWAIVAYVRALQLSQDAKLEDVEAKEQAALTNPPTAPAAKPADPHGKEAP